MKIAIVHDHFLYIGGAERVALFLLRMFPHADIYTAFVNPDVLPMIRKITSGNIYVSPYGRWITTANFADWLKPLLYGYWETLDLSDYDVVISSSHSFSSKSVIVRPPTAHLSYVHTPPRYLWSGGNETQWMRRQPMSTFLSPLMTWLRKKDFEGAQRPNVLIANSQNVQKRIKKYYHRDSIVFYPPVHIPSRVLPRRPQYYVCVSRLVKQKGIDIAIHACNLLQRPLLVVGVGRQEAHLHRIAGPTITFRGWVPDEDIDNVYGGAKALIFPAKSEDFGMVPVEAMAHGVPVIACRSGGVIESVVHGKTGLLFNGLSPKGIARAISEFERLKFSEGACRSQASQFSESVFQKGMKDIIKRELVKS